MILFLNISTLEILLTYVYNEFQTTASCKLNSTLKNFSLTYVAKIYKAVGVITRKCS